MKKVLKLLFALSTVTTLPLSVIACRQDNLDDILQLIHDGKIQYNINEISNIEIDGATLENKLLTKNESETLVKSIVTKILDEQTITWYVKGETSAGTKCYNFKFTNGETNSATDDITWGVDKSTQRMKVLVEYNVGTVNQSGDFDAKQKIDMAYNIKVGTSESDKEVTNWVNTFNDKILNNIDNQVIEVNLSTPFPPNASSPITPPKDGTVWEDIDKEKVIPEIYLTIEDKINAATGWDDKNTIETKSIESSKENKVVGDQVANLKLTVRLGESEGSTNIFTIKFI